MLVPTVSINNSLPPCHGSLTYISNEESFSFRYRYSQQAHRLAWLCFGLMEIAVSCETGQLLGVSGYVNRRLWTKSLALPPGPPQAGSLMLEDFSQCQIGVAYNLAGDCDSNIYFNSMNGWIFIGEAVFEADCFIEFASNCCAVVNRNRLVALWLHPENWQNLGQSTE